MVLLGNIIKKGLQVRSKIKFPLLKPNRQQELVLRKLLRIARETQFGKHYQFEKLLSTEHVAKTFSETIPIFDYNKIHNEWWYKMHNGMNDVTWPGEIKYFALSSGTSEASSKYIPVSNDMLKAMRKASFKQIYTLAHYNLPSNLFEKGILMLGGSTHLNYNGKYFAGDLSGINASKIPFWFQHFYKPGPEIAQEKEWAKKLEEIVAKAPQWDIWVIAGVPAWLTILMEKIIEHYQVKTIHDIWPNLKIYTWGGVSIEPYRKSLEKLLKTPLIYFETYLASEGFIAYDARPDRTGMQLILNNYIYYEFIPFNEHNFDADGNVKPNARTYALAEVQENEKYALLLSTCSGAWRYLIGDVVEFTSLKHYELKIVGRTKHYISLCGEHLSVENMNHAIAKVNEEYDLDIQEFAVVGEARGSLFAHRWYVGCDKSIDAALIADCIDKHLKVINDDYAVERTAAITEVVVEVLSTKTFLNFLAQKGKLGGQHKFPRVLKEPYYSEWIDFLQKLPK